MGTFAVAVSPDGKAYALKSTRGLSYLFPFPGPCTFTSALGGNAFPLLPSTWNRSKFFVDAPSRCGDTTIAYTTCVLGEMGLSTLRLVVEGGPTTQCLTTERVCLSGMLGRARS